MKYSISDLAQLSGISVHNIRIWERRYGALKPSRTEGNTRYYDDEQLKRLLCIAGLYHAGHKISRACALDKDDMSALLLEQIGGALLEEHRFEYFILQIVNQSLVYNEAGINELISDSFQVNGVQGTYKHVIYPILVRMGLMWLNESLCPSQEHFLSAIIRQKLLAAIDSLNPVVGEPGSGWLLFLPEDEDHDIGLLLASYLLRAAGRPVVYLGPKVPLFALANTADATKPQNLLFFMTRARPVADAQDYVDLLSAQFPAANILLSGNIKVLGSLDYPPGVTWLRSLADFESLIANPTEMPKP
ncbi:DNA-binding transcriptional regulator, MerR family [Mucilaginibacter gossypiicola]|uniref:DNA-binding transcriptional regulator, MerR family n=1 Tax=Mucilaginibacter gossypiicola TaxID=551995 RepID=A0A1H8KU88_9SPHI|nr:MerR family transcriptional regulator [Mucilaginibacter gossypiicola]SEN95968.1 DNA-binding transcriptional regulator, MerR family [Mucilaginibacter gossypiicola]